MNNNDYKSSEVGIALENYNYNTMVKMHIPSIMTFLNKSGPISKVERLNTSNISNKVPAVLGISKVTTCNYVELYVPSESGIGTPRYSKPDKHGETYKLSDGRKGDKFVLMFVGGNINMIKILGKMY